MSDQDKKPENETELDEQIERGLEEALTPPATTMPVPEEGEGSTFVDEGPHPLPGAQKPEDLMPPATTLPIPGEEEPEDLTSLVPEEFPSDVEELKQLLSDRVASADGAMEASVELQQRLAQEIATLSGLQEALKQAVEDVGARKASLTEVYNRMSIETQVVKTGLFGKRKVVRKDLQPK